MTIRRKAAEAVWRPGKAPRYLSPEKHTRPVERGRHLARTLLKFLGSSLWGPLPKIFWGIFFSGVLGFLDARRGRAGPSPPLYGPDFLTIPSQNFLESKTELEATEMNPRTAMICIACARISDRDVVDAGRGTK